MKRTLWSVGLSVLLAASQGGVLFSDEAPVSCHRSAKDGSEKGEKVTRWHVHRLRSAPCVKMRGCYVCRNCPLYDDLDIIDEYDDITMWPNKDQHSWMRELMR